uniref:HIG1 domain-containing protein n=1 Tax=Arundo donax TaxID=35708 RepID=A0A0A9ENB0_ARUDO
MESKMERMSSSVQSWVEEHKLTTIGAVWTTAVGASVAYSRRKTPQRTTSLRLIHARMHAQALTLAVLGGAALAHHYYNKSSSMRRDDLDYDFYSQLPSATSADGQENERWSW